MGQTDRRTDGQTDGRTDVNNAAGLRVYQSAEAAQVADGRVAGGEFVG